MYKKQVKSRYIRYSIMIEKQYLCENAKPMVSPKVTNVDSLGMSTTARNSSFELLRLILMFLIIVHHVIVNGLSMVHMSQPAFEPIIRNDDLMLLCIVNCFCIPAVNVFVLVSGFFEIRPTATKVISLLFSMIFYTLVFTFPYLLYVGDYIHALSSLSILSHSPYWFLIDYLFLMLFAPMLNMMFKAMGGGRKKNIFTFSYWD